GRNRAGQGQRANHSRARGRESPGGHPLGEHSAAVVFQFVHPILLVCRIPAVPERPAGHAKSQNQTRSDRCVTSEPILATLPPQYCRLTSQPAIPMRAVTAIASCRVRRSAPRRGGYDPPMTVDAVIFDWGGTLTP